MSDMPESVAQMNVAAAQEPVIDTPEQQVDTSANDASATTDPSADVPTTSSTPKKKKKKQPFVVNPNDPSYTYEVAPDRVLSDFLRVRSELERNVLPADYKHAFEHFVYFLIDRLPIDKSSLSGDFMTMYKQVIKFLNTCDPQAINFTWDVQDLFLYFAQRNEQGTHKEFIQYGITCLSFMFTSLVHDTETRCIERLDGQAVSPAVYVQGETLINMALIKAEETNSTVAIGFATISMILFERLFKPDQDYVLERFLGYTPASTTLTRLQLCQAKAKTVDIYGGFPFNPFAHLAIYSKRLGGARSGPSKLNNVSLTSFDLAVYLKNGLHGIKKLNRLHIFSDSRLPDEKEKRSFGIIPLRAIYSDRHVLLRLFAIILQYGLGNVLSDWEDLAERNAAFKEQYTRDITSFNQSGEAVLAEHNSWRAELEQATSENMRSFYSNVKRNRPVRTTENLILNVAFVQNDIANALRIRCVEHLKLFGADVFAVNSISQNAGFVIARQDKFDKKLMDAILRQPKKSKTNESVQQKLTFDFISYPSWNSALRKKTQIALESLFNETDDASVANPLFKFKYLCVEGATEEKLEFLGGLYRFFAQQDDKKYTSIHVAVQFRNSNYIEYVCKYICQKFYKAAQIATSGQEELKTLTIDRFAKQYLIDRLELFCKQLEDQRDAFKNIMLATNYENFTAVNEAVNFLGKDSSVLESLFKYFPNDIDMHRAMLNDSLYYLLMRLPNSVSAKAIQDAAAFLRDICDKCDANDTSSKTSSLHDRLLYSYQPANSRYPGITMNAAEVGDLMESPARAVFLAASRSRRFIPMQVQPIQPLARVVQAQVQAQVESQPNVVSQQAQVPFKPIHSLINEQSLFSEKNAEPAAATIST